MHNNALLRKLGFDAQDRVVIIHADDIGMCQATLSAFADLVDVGLVSSGSVMVPCPWFPEAATWCRNHPAVDVGVHLTLTCEWNGYRWGPLSTRDPASGLLDEEGHFHRRRQSLWQQASPHAVRVEMQAQVERARKAGLDLTHLDCHMFAAMEERFMPHYIRLGYYHGMVPHGAAGPRLVGERTPAALAAMAGEGVADVRRACHDGPETVCA